MSAPFIIWTMRRTGGTTLTDIAMRLSEWPKTEHEPFNWDRRFGWVTKHYAETKDWQALRANMARVLHKKPNIKHCYEILAEPVSDMLMVAATAKGYRHVILDRRDEAGRLMSLELARLTGAWGKHDATGVHAKLRSGEVRLAPIDVATALDHLRHCHERRRWLAERLQARSLEPFVLYFEDLFGDVDAGRRRFKDLLRYLDIADEVASTESAAIEHALAHRGQDSRSIYDYVPNSQQVVDALAKEAAACHFEFKPSSQGSSA
jgi:hypothetical protein